MASWAFRGLRAKLPKHLNRKAGSKSRSSEPQATLVGCESPFDGVTLGCGELGDKAFACNSEPGTASSGIA